MRKKITYSEIKEKGQKIENEMFKRFSNKGKVERPGNEWCDFLFRGIPIEVKSAELLFYNGHSKGFQNTTIGSFNVISESHKKLEDSEGWYCLVMLLKGEKIMTKMVRATEAEIRSRRLLMRTLYSSECISIDGFFKHVKENIGIMKKIESPNNQRRKLLRKIIGFKKMCPDEMLKDEFKRIFDRYRILFCMSPDCNFNEILDKIIENIDEKSIEEINHKLGEFKNERRKIRKIMP